MARKTGTKEWSSHSVNCATGCRHGCLYCYARWREVERFKRVKPGQWENEQVRIKAVLARYGKKDGVVMFPTAHDITPAKGYPGTVDACVCVLIKLLEAGNQVLIVSKPHLDCITCLCVLLAKWKKQVEFRFSITTLDVSRAAFWEPGAPTPHERLAVLKYARTHDWKTSVSCEPLLDVTVDEVCRLVDACSAFANVDETIWIGCMNDIAQRTAWYIEPRSVGEPMAIQVNRRCDLQREINRLRDGYSVKNLRAIYERLTGNSLAYCPIRWKDSIQKALGLSGPTG